MKDKRITITGGKGFLGIHLIKALQDKGYANVSIADRPEYNLILNDDVRRLYEKTKPDIVIHLAAKVGGIGFNRENPGALFYENIMMGAQLIHEGYLQGLEKFVALGTICATRNSPLYHLMKTISGTVIPKKRMPPTASPRR
jgi:GDP-L-fucose synthase